MRVLCLFTISLIVAVCTQKLPGPKHGKNVVCYFASWAVYRPDLGRVTIEDLEPSLCTHLVYAFAGLDETTNSVKSLNPWEDLDSGKSAYKRLVALKQKYPHLKVTLAVGGWDEGSLKFSNMASNPDSRATFIRSVLEMINTHHFDGIDLHWKYPAARDGKSYDKENYVLLVKELSEAFKPHGYILSAAFGANKSILDTAYDLEKLGPYLDLIHLLTYDYHGTWEMLIGANAPLIGLTEFDTFSVTYSVDYILSQGVSPEKLVLGLPMYGRSFLLTHPETKDLEFGSTSAQESGFMGPYTKEPGFLAYNEICSAMSNPSSAWVYNWHEQSSTPYLRDGERVVTYDNGRSIAAKIKMAMSKGLGGLMAWSVDMDDFRGNCSETNMYEDFEQRYQAMATNPLLREVARNLELIDVTKAPLDGPSYLRKDHELYLRLPRPKYSNYLLLQTINDAISLSLEEKRIEDEVAKIIKENGPINVKKIVCYMASWSVYRPGPGQYNIEDIDPTLCTHLVYSYAGIDHNTYTIKSLDPYQDLEENYGKRAYKRLLALKEKNPKLKLTIAVGGWTEGSKKYSKMAASAKNREDFINSVLVFLEKYKFDGVVLNWEYPTKRGGKPHDRNNFVLLVKEMSEAFKPHGYILSAALGSERETMTSAYDLTKLNQHLDLVYLMSYDYHGSWSGAVGANAPLKGLKKDDVFSVESTINYAIDQGISPYKLMLGLPIYGRTFLLENPGVKLLEFGSTPVSTTGFQGPYTKEDGYIIYNEICMEISNKSSSWVYEWHEQSSTPYLRDGERVISYDNGRSVAAKIKMAVSKGLGGVMVWSMDMDDMKGNCPETDAFLDFEERFHRMNHDPLLTKASNKLNLLDINLAPVDGPSYVMKNKRLHLRLPHQKYTNHTLLRIINKALSLSVEEQAIEDEMARRTKENEINIMIEGDSDNMSIVRVFIVAASTKAGVQKNPFLQIQHNISFRFS